MAVFHLRNKTLLHSLIKTTLRNSRYISTSQKNRETASVAQTAEQIKTEAPTAKKNWVSFGFDQKDETNDKNTLNSSFFFSVTMCLVWGTFIWAYLPDTHMRDWAQREAFLELRRREKAGLEPVSPNYVDPSKMNLPSDEELGNTEIII